MIVDCDRCEVRGDACGDCVITVLLGSPPGGVELDGTERRALENLAAAGLVPGLQLVRSDGGGDSPCSSGCTRAATVTARAERVGEPAAVKGGAR